MSQVERKLKYMQKKSIFTKIIVIGLLIFAVWFYHDSFEEIWWGIKQITWARIAICMLLATIYYLLDGSLIYLASKEFNKDFSVKNAIATTFLCEFYRLITLGTGAFVAEILYLKKSGISSSQATATSVYKYTIKKTSIFVCGVFSILWLLVRSASRTMMKEYILFAVIASLIFLVIIWMFILIAISERFVQFVASIIKAVGNKVGFVRSNEAKWTEFLFDLNNEGKVLWRNWRKAIGILGINIAKCIAIYGVVMVILYGNGELAGMDYTAIMAAAFFLSGVIPAPSGVMSVEFVYGLLIGPFLSVGVSVPAILTFRFFTWIYPATIGGVCKLVYRFEDLNQAQ